MLTAIRQEASDLQDPGQGPGATMRACLADRLDKSEFASIGLDDAPFVCEVLRCMRPCATAKSGILPTPGPQELQCLVTYLSVSGTFSRTGCDVTLPLRTLTNL